MSQLPPSLVIRFGWGSEDGCNKVNTGALNYVFEFSQHSNWFGKNDSSRRQTARMMPHRCLVSSGYHYVCIRQTTTKPVASPDQELVYACRKCAKQGMLAIMQGTFVQAKQSCVVGKQPRVQVKGPTSNIIPALDKQSRTCLT